MDKEEMAWFVFWSVLMIALGALGTVMYQDFQDKRMLNGVYLYNEESKADARQIVKGMEPSGDWVCINVAYEMTYREAYDTCVHECSHMSFTEIYAEKCEKDPIKCMEYLE